MLWDFEKIQIFRLKEIKVFSWDQIATAINVKKGTECAFYQKQKNLHQMPPRPNMPKSAKITATMGLLIKR